MTAPVESYARLAAIPWLGAEGAALLRSGRVVQVGGGNIGAQLAAHMALLGVPLTIVDRDTVAPENLATQPFGAAVGAPKAEALARRLGELNPSCRIEPVHADFRRLGAGALRGVALALSAVDSVSARAAIARACVRLGVPLVDAGIDGRGRALFGRVAAYDPRLPGSPCYLCPHNSDSLALALQAGVVPAGCRVSWRAPEEPAPPTLAVSALGGVAASIQAIWALKILLGRGAEVAGAEVYFDLDRGTMAPHRLRANPRCLLDHRVWSPIPLGRGARALTLAQTFAAAEAILPGKGELVLRLDGRSMVVRLHCPDCGSVRAAGRLADALSDAETTCACGAEMRPGPLELYDAFDRSRAGDLLNRSWDAIGAPEDEIVLAERDGRDAALLLGGER